MTHPIIPLPELVQQWAKDRVLLNDPTPFPEYIANRAAAWGADKELDACCEWLPDVGEMQAMLRAARRPKPKPPTLKEQALLAIDIAVADGHLSTLVANVVRRALEQLDD